MSGKNIYLDYAASTPLDPAVAEAMAAVQLLPGNPSAIHAHGRMARLALDGARREVAVFLAAREDEVIFTSGATEANNAALLGWWKSLSAESRKDARLLVSPLEHSSVLAAVKVLEADGAAVDWLAVGRDGVVATDNLAELVKPETVLVACQWVNNLFGTIQPVEAIGTAVRAERTRRVPIGRPILFHVDAVQAARFLELRPDEIGADTLALSAHKIYGPKGVGCLWVRRNLKLTPLIVGGSQEGGRRSGTENVVGIVGFGTAARLEAERREEELDTCRGLESILLSAQCPTTNDQRQTTNSQLPTPNGFDPIGDRTRSVPGIMGVSVGRTAGDLLALRLDAEGFSVATGSACDSGKREPSRAARSVLGEQGAVRGFVRISFGRAITGEDIALLSDALTRVGR